ncbi:hypothetical protein CC78DRAFT_587677 [Lojkania enalia]|uniref:Uncharacterized protein n=1 Tax=Lojkania enalia TaxID=147567 RepID=A0A9P4JX18_9PLEO|nr:hypothetical protein CC78DRAFT_587677 [Didymosphaeria enalia]
MAQFLPEPERELDGLVKQLWVSRSMLKEILRRFGEKFDEDKKYNLPKEIISSTRLDEQDNQQDNMPLGTRVLAFRAAEQDQSCGPYDLDKGLRYLGN